MGLVRGQWTVQDVSYGFPGDLIVRLDKLQDTET